MTVYPKETTDLIGDQLKSYFYRHKKTTHKMSYRDAATLIDYAGGPGARGGGDGVAQYGAAAVHVTGGGRRRPTSEKVERILKRLEAEAAAGAEWDGVVEQLLTKCRDEPTADRLVMLAYKDDKPEAEVCEAMHIERTTYYEYRKTILSWGATMAVRAGLIKF